MKTIGGTLGGRLPTLWQPWNARVVAGLLGVCVVYYLGARLGFVLAASPVPISMLWVPNALLLAAFLIAPPRLWPAVVAAAVPAHLAAQLQSGVPLPMALAWLVSNCAEGLLGAVIIRLVLRRELHFDVLRHAGVFIVCGALLSPVVLSLIDVANVRWLADAHWRIADYWDLVRIRTYANVLSALVVVPFVVTLVRGAHEAYRTTKARYVEMTLLLAGLAAVSAAAFLWASPYERNAPAFFYAPLPFLLWAAVRFGPLGVSTANLLLVGIAVWGAVNGLGPFLEGTPEENARTVQMFLIAVMVPLLMLAAALAERRKIEREAREQLQQLTHLSRVAMLGGLSGALAHELNQPLTAILSNAQAAQHQLAAGKLDGQDLSDILRNIVSADGRARDVIARLRGLLQKGENHLETVDANAVVKDVLEISRSTLRERRVSVVTDLESPLPAVHGDRVQLQQVLLNLALNACEAMAMNGEKRTLTISTRAVHGAEVQISVIDQGCGLSAEARSRLFQPFYTTKPHGLGLGLYISRSIVAAHGGRLWTVSMPQRETVFHVALPSVLSRAQRGEHGDREQASRERSDA